MDKTNEQFNSGAVDTGSKQNSTVSAAATSASASAKVLLSEIRW